MWWSWHPSDWYWDTKGGAWILGSSKQDNRFCKYLDQLMKDSLLLMLHEFLGFQSWWSMDHFCFTWCHCTYLGSSIEYHGWYLQGGGCGVKLNIFSYWWLFGYCSCWQCWRVLMVILGIVIVCSDGVCSHASIYIRANRTQFANVSLHSITDDDVAEVLALPALEGYGDEGKKPHF